jgi:hypothetical protein
VALEGLRSPWRVIRCSRAWRPAGA